MKKQLTLELFLSIFAIFLTILNFIYGIYRDNNNDKELLSFFPGYVSHDEQVLIIDLHSTEMNSSGLLPLYYETIICNNSKQKTSIIHYSISKLDQNNTSISDIFNKEVPFDIAGKNSYLKQGIFDENGKELKLPVSIEPGEYIRVKLKIDLQLTDNVLNIIKKQYQLNQSINFDKLDIYLSKNNIDIYGNTVITTFYDDTNTTTIDNRGGGEDPIYKIDFTTTKNNHFTALVGNYAFLY